MCSIAEVPEALIAASGAWFVGRRSAESAICKWLEYLMQASTFARAKAKGKDEVNKRGEDALRRLVIEIPRHQGDMLGGDGPLRRRLRQAFGP